MIRRIRAILNSRPLTLAVSVVMLLMSVVFVADVLELRGDTGKAERQVRKTIAESMAIQMTFFASSSDSAGLEQQLLRSVSRHEELQAAALVDANGKIIAQYGDSAKLKSMSSGSTSTHVSVPIFNKSERWGEVHAVFTQSSAPWLQFRYYAFVLLGSFVICLLFLRKVLVQLDPGRVVPTRVNSAFNMFTESVIILDNKMQILIINKAAECAIGKKAEELLGKNLDDWPWEKDDDWQSPWAAAMRTGVNVSDHPLILVVAGDRRILMTSCSVVGDEDVSNRGVLVTLNDMTAIEEKNRELAKTLVRLTVSEREITAKNKALEVLATSDSLTGLFNRRAFLERFESDFEAARAQNTPLCCLMTDIDHFKRINDTFGHSAGDEVICAVAKTLTENTAAGDIVCRYGGEEFVIVLPGQSIEATMALAEAIRQDIMKIADNASFDVESLSSSFGVAEYMPGVTDVMDLLDQADQALYFAKQSGRNKAIAYSENIVQLKKVTEADSQITAEGSAILSRVVELEAIVDERGRDLDTLRTYDILTGVPNRKLYFQRIDTEIIRAKRNENNVGILSLEISDLDTIFSTFGHSATDELVVSFVSRLQRALRSTDLAALVTDDHGMSRITTNEFGILLSDLGTSDQILPVLARLRRLLADSFTVDGQKIFLGVSIGVALFPLSGNTPTALVEEASHARVEARKHFGKFNHLFASTSLDRQSRDYIELESELHEAIAKNMFEVVYQPKLSLARNEVCGLEALVRWYHPEKGSIPPDQFIKIAESSGLIHDISAIVFSRALTQLSQWRDAGWTDLKLSINISALQLRQPNLAVDVLAAIKKAQVPASAIELEITETSLIESTETAYPLLKQLRDAGVRISMDDFGTGYTSLALLADLPLDSVKIDRCFIEDLHTSKRSQVIVESVITMSHALNLWVVGEGVEINEQLDKLIEMDCDEIQGFLISKPVAASKIHAILLKYSPATNKQKSA